MRYFITAAFLSLCAGQAQAFRTVELFGLRRQTCSSSTTTTRLFEKKKKGGLFGDYKFGDITKSVLKKTATSITGKEDYEFGDISRTLLGNATNAVRELTGNEEYQFGDISRALDIKAKDFVADYTSKEEYQVGDISKEILRRISSGEYKVQDIFLLCKILFTLGVGLSPVASALPAKLLLQMMNISLAGQVTDRLLGALASTLDERFKHALTGDKNYQIGDITKKAILRFVGKDAESDEYEFGDISKAIARRVEEKDRSDRIGVSNSSPGKDHNIIDAEIIEELERLDRAASAGATSAQTHTTA